MDFSAAMAQWRKDGGYIAYDSIDRTWHVYGWDCGIYNRATCYDALRMGGMSHDEANAELIDFVEKGE